MVKQTRKASALDQALMQRSARLYALADASDPFSYARAMTHLQNGVAEYANADGREAFYSAEEGMETRILPDKTEYQAVIYRNRFRP